MKVFITGGYHGLIQEIEETRTFEQCPWIIRKGGTANPKVQINVWEDKKDAFNYVERKTSLRLNMAHRELSDASYSYKKIIQV